MKLDDRTIDLFIFVKIMKPAFNSPFLREVKFWPLSDWDNLFEITFSYVLTLAYISAYFPAIEILYLVWEYAFTWASKNYIFLLKNVSFL